MTTTERKWKPGDKFVLRTRSGKSTRHAVILRVVALSGVREFAVHVSNGIEGYSVSHIETGTMVDWGETKAQAVVRAARTVSAKGGADAIRAAVEGHK